MKNLHAIVVAGQDERVDVARTRIEEDLRARLERRSRRADIIDEQHIMAGKQTISRRMPIMMPLISLVSLVSLKICQFFLRQIGQGKSPLQVLPALLTVEAELRFCRPRALQEADERDPTGIEPVTEDELRLVEAALPLALRMQRHGHGQVDKGGLGPSQKLGGP